MNQNKRILLAEATVASRCHTIRLQYSVLLAWCGIALPEGNYKLELKVDTVVYFK